MPGRWDTPRTNGWPATPVFNCGAFTPVHQRDASMLLLSADGGKLTARLRCVNEAGRDTSRTEERWEVPRPAAT